jgi:DNA-binding transcriptional LysR family regulator
MILSMRYTNIEKADLNLLLGFQALIEERSVTRAARRMFLSQPAMSRVLDRLQEMFKDELFIRTASGYEPTKQATAVYSELNELLPKIDRLLQKTSFQPSEASDRLRIAAGPYASVWLMPRLIGLLAKQAPNMQVDISSESEGFQRIEANQIDLLLSSRDVPRNLRAALLLEEPYMCLMRMSHPLLGRRLTLRRYLAARHISGYQPLLDELLSRRGYGRDIRVKIADPFPIGMIVERTDLIATLALRTARQLSKFSRIRMVPAPLEIGTFKYSQIWHSRNDSDPAHRWLRGIIQTTYAQPA